MEELTIRAEQLLEVIGQIKFLDTLVAKHCTGRCNGCPMKSECLGEGTLDPDADYDIEKCADFIDYYDKWQAEQDKEQARREDQEFTAVTGIDYGWYMFNEDRSVDV